MAYNFQVALSYPGEFASRVECIAVQLADALGGREQVLFAGWRRGEFARPNLNLYLADLYQRSRLIVFFLCAEYAAKEWCGLEWRVGLELLKTKRDDRLMFLRLDLADIPGLYSIDGYLDIRDMPDREVVQNVLHRLAPEGALASTSSDVHEPAGTRFETTRCTAYVGPERIYQVLKQRLDAAERSIRIGVYDISSIEIRKTLLSALQRGVTVSIMTEAPHVPAPGGGARDRSYFDPLVQAGANLVEVNPGRSSAAAPFTAYHLKLIVIDGLWTLVQNANLVERHVPTGGKGTRCTGLAVESQSMSEYFTGLLDWDRSMVLKCTGQMSKQGEKEYEPYDPPLAFEPLEIGRSTGAPAAIQKVVRLSPVLSPENSAGSILALLKSARKSILIEQQIIHPAKCPIVTGLLGAIGSAVERNPSLEIKLVLSIYQTFGRWMEKLASAASWDVLSFTRILDNLQNKLVVIDEQRTYIGSHNWSENGFTRNRDVGLIAESREVGEYFAHLVREDWKHSHQCDFRTPCRF